MDLKSYRKIVQYFWDPEPKNDESPSEPIWCLGNEYLPSSKEARQHTEPADEASDSSISRSSSGLGSSQDDAGTSHSVSSEQEPSPAADVQDQTVSHGWPESFLNDFESRIWITYRSNFPPIPRTQPKTDEQDAGPSLTLNVRLRSQLLESRGFTSDTGWGCMIRSGQSLLATALSILRFGRGWRRGSRSEEEGELLSLFADRPDAPFSIHRFVDHGAAACNKHPGEWFGPSATARCIEALSSRITDSQLRVYNTNDTSEVFEDRLMRIAKNGSNRFHPTLILLGIRLGIDRVTPVYWNGLTASLQYPQSIGIAGGRPSASHYFVGVQGLSFFYLDPHHTRPSLRYHGADDPYSGEELDSYHTRRLRRLHIDDMDPSMLIGFLIKDEQDWHDWKTRVKSTPGKPIVHILSGDSQLADTFERAEALDEVEALDDDF